MHNPKRRFVLIKFKKIASAERILKILISAKLSIVGVSHFCVSGAVILYLMDTPIRRNLSEILPQQPAVNGMVSWPGIP